MNKAIEKCMISHELMNKKLNEEERKISEESMKKSCKAPILNLSNWYIYVLKDEKFVWVMEKKVGETSRLLAMQETHSLSITKNS